MNWNNMDRVKIILLLFLSFGQANAQVFNNRIAIQGYLKSGTAALNDTAGFPMQFIIKKNSTVLWCQTPASNVPVVDGVLSVVLSGSSNCQSLVNSLSANLFDHSGNTDTFVFDVVVDVNKDGFGGVDDASFAGIDLLPSPLALNANKAQVANSVSGVVDILNGGTNASTAAGARTNLGLGNLAVINTSGVATNVLLGDGTFGAVPTPANFSGVLVGDVSGTQSATTVAKIQGRNVASTLPTSGQVLAWNAGTSTWEPSAQTLSGVLGLANGGTNASTAAGARTNLGLGNLAVINTSGVATNVLLGNGTFGAVPTPANFSGSLLGDVTGTQVATTVAKIQGRNVATAAPTGGQVLTWNAGTTTWEPTTQATAPVSSVAGKTGAVTILSADVSDATNLNSASKIVSRDASGNFSAGTITASLVNSSAGLVVAAAAGNPTGLGDNTSTSSTSLRSGTGGITVAVTGTSGNVAVTAGSASGTITVGNSSTGTSLLGNTGAGAITTVQSPVVNIGLTGTATTTTVGSTTGASTTTIQAGSGKVKIGSTGTAMTAMGGCTIAATAISTIATNYSCTGVPASLSVAVFCSSTAALSSPGTNAINCRATGTASQVSCNTVVANSVSTTYVCMWLQP